MSIELTYQSLFGKNEFRVTPEYGTLEKYFDGPRYYSSEELWGRWHMRYQQLDKRFGFIAAIEKTKCIAAGCPLYIKEGDDNWLVPYLDDIATSFKTYNFGIDGWTLNLNKKEIQNLFIDRYESLGPIGLSRAIFAMGFLESHISGDSVFYPNEYEVKHCQKVCDEIKSFIDSYVDVRWIFDSFRDIHFKAKLTKNYFKGIKLLAVVPSGEKLICSSSEIESSFEPGEILPLQIIRYNNTVPSANFYIKKLMHQIEPPITRHRMTFACADLSQQKIRSFCSITYLIPESWILACEQSGVIHQELFNLTDFKSPIKTIDKIIELQASYFRNRL